MRPVLTFSFLILVILLSSSVQARIELIREGNPVWDKVGNTIKLSTVRVVGFFVNEGKETLRASCATGMVAYYNGYIVTKKHVIALEPGEKRTNIKVVFNDPGQREAHLKKYGEVRNYVDHYGFEASLVAYDATRDLALLKVSDEVASKHVLAVTPFGTTQDIVPGSSVAIYGHHNSAPFIGISGELAEVTDRYYSSDIGKYLYQKCLRILGVSLEGSGGGPVVTTSGKIIGMHTGSGIFVYAIHIDEVKDFILSQIGDRIRSEYRGRLDGTIPSYSHSPVMNPYVWLRAYGELDPQKLPKSRR